MNERIKALAEQAGMEPDMLDENEGIIWWLSNSDLEKFAALIVKGCIEELESSQRGDPYTGEVFDCEYNTCIKEQCEMLKECFGVE